MISLENLLTILAIGVPIFLGVLSFIIYKAVKFGEVKRDFKYIKEKTDGMKCTEHEHKIGAHKETMDRIDHNINFILSTLIKQPVPTIEKHSPLSLSDLGKRIAKDLELNQMIGNNWEKILYYLDINNIASKNAYDIQQFCIETACISLDKFFDEHGIDKIKMYAYNNGNSLFYYGSMIGIMIRDVYFESKGIPVTAVDEHIPAQNPA
ncbi:MAG: hypothetical protein LBH22_02990 [Bacteroidales bacterium]|jgi:hypothetical protein|nr:hypothetical protein [Bacteroidales bacterium]